MRRLAHILVLVATTAALLALPLPASARHIPVESEFEHTDNMHLVGFSPRANTIDPSPPTATWPSGATWRSRATTTGSGSWTSPGPPGLARSSSRSASATRATWSSGGTS
jgi:hypothetical protein